MAFKQNPWKYSDVTDEPAPIVEGRRYLKITDCFYVENEDKYVISVEDLSDGAEFSLGYWLTDTRDNKNTPNRPARGTLVALGTALNGEPCGIPNPGDVIGGVVIGDITKSTSGYRRCFKFFPIPESMMAFSDIEQFCVPDEPESTQPAEEAEQ